MVELATQVKRRRGTEDENNAFFGAEGEITVDLTNKELRLHTGNNKLGGYRIGRTTDRTNCITEIPQDIKLELNNGTLTLKAGSKVYVPNGQGVFNELIIQNDLTATSGGGSPTLLLVEANGTRIVLENETDCVSGSTDPLSGMAYHTWYDTTNNQIKRYGANGAFAYYCALPIANVVRTDTTITSINQVFNGFGYIGSTVFVLPNVRGLIPNGRNADGSLNNIEVTVGSVSTNSGGGADQQNIYYGLQSDGSLKLNGRYSYDSINNIIYNGTTVENSLFVDRYNKSGGQIVHFDAPTAFHALGYNDSEYIAHQAMPSDRNIDLAVGASGTTYTAPADGWFALSITLSAVSGYAFLRADEITSIATRGSASGTYCFLPVKKGSVCLLNYNNATINRLLFVYAEGSK